MAALILFLSFAYANLPPSDVVGSWQFTSYRYQGVENPIPNPDLVLVFEFHADGTDLLYWTRKGQKGFCRRGGTYQTADGILTESVTWIDPDNDSSCSSDPDMQMGKTTLSPYRIRDDRFELDLNMGNDVFTYLWTRRSNAP